MPAGSCAAMVRDFAACLGEKLKDAAEEEQFGPVAGGVLALLLCEVIAVGVFHGALIADEVRPDAARAPDMGHGFAGILF